MKGEKDMQTQKINVIPDVAKRRSGICQSELFWYLLLKCLCFHSIGFYSWATCKVGSAADHLKSCPSANHNNLGSDSCA